MQKFLITESERNRIKNLYQKNDIVFDFVLTENQKYLIFFDNVFIKDNGGTCIGSIWENTHIFNEILTKTISKIDTLTESVKDELNEEFKKIQWNKESIKKWIQEKDIVLEQEEEGFFSKLATGAKNLGKKIISGVSSLAMSAFKQGVLPMLRWIRRNAYTNIGIVVDAVIAFFSFKSSAVVWFIIVGLDVYEIATGDYDKQDSERLKNPYGMLISDALSAVLTTAFGFLFRKIVSTGGKQALKKYPNLIDGLKKLLSKIPGLKNSVVNTMNVIKGKMPNSSSIIGKIISSINNVFNGVVNFIKRLLSQEGAEAVAYGGVGLAINKGISAISGKETKNAKQAIQINPDESDIIKFAKENGYIQ